MADSYTPITEATAGTLDNVDEESLTVSAVTVKRQRIQVTGSAAAEVARVENAAPGATDYGLVTRNLVGDGGDVTLGAQADAAWTSGSGSVIAILKAIWTRLRGGQATMANSLPVTVASDQGPIADQISTGNALTLTNTTNAVTMAVNGRGTMGVQISGWTAGSGSAPAVIFEATIDGTNWSTWTAIVPTTGVIVTTASGNGVWQVDLAGVQSFRVRSTVAGTGASATVGLVANDGDTVVALAAPLPAGTNTMGAVTQASGPWTTQDNSNGATSSAAPARATQIGSNAASTTPAAATAGNLVALLTDLLGKLVVLPYALGDMLVSGVVANLATTTSTSCIAAPATGLRNYVTWISVQNLHATVDTEFLLQDGSAGTTIFRGFAKAAGGGITLALPSPLKQPTTATALFVACVTTGANVDFSLGGWKGV